MGHGPEHYAARNVLMLPSGRHTNMHGGNIYDSNRLYLYRRVKGRRHNQLDSSRSDPILLKFCHRGSCQSY